MRLPRPYIPLSIRVRVAERQHIEKWGGWPPRIDLSLRSRLDYILFHLFGVQKAELHHRPALINRPRCGNDYVPRANDPNYLIYLAADEHDIETRVRGQHGQHSDLALARKRKRKERKAKRRKTKWASRPFPKGRNFRRQK